MLPRHSVDQLKQPITPVYVKQCCLEHEFLLQLRFCYETKVRKVGCCQDPNPGRALAGQARSHEFNSQWLPAFLILLFSVGLM